jgi:hypothetical protein
MVPGQPVVIEKTRFGVTYKQYGLKISPRSMRKVLYQYPWSQAEALQSKYLNWAAMVTGLTGAGCVGYPIWRVVVTEGKPDMVLITGGTTAFISAVLLSRAAQDLLVRAVEFYNSQIKPVPILRFRNNKLTVTFSF